MSAAAVPSHPRLPVWLRPLVRTTRRGPVRRAARRPRRHGDHRRRGRAARPPRRRAPARVDRAGGGGGRVPPARWRALLELTTDLGLLTDRTPPVRGSGPDGTGRVVVDGCGEVASAVADALVQTGTTVVHGRAAVDRAVASPLRPRPDLVVLVGSPVVDPRRGTAVAAARGTTPARDPGRAPNRGGPACRRLPGAPCLWRLERHRADRDDAWPAVMSQAGRTLALAGPPRAGTTRSARAGARSSSAP